MKDLHVNLKEEKDKRIISLVGNDIMPKKYSERTVTPFGLIVIWFAMAVSITLFITAAELYDSLTVFEILVACFIGHTLLFTVMWVTQDIGIKYGIPFCVSLRPAFGYIGALIAAYFRAIPAIFWFGFQTFIAASAMNEIVKLAWNYENIVLWIILFGLLQIAHTALGIEAITRLSIVATPMLIIVGFYIIYIAFVNYNIDFNNIWSMKGEGGSFSMQYAIMSYLGGWATLSVSIMDITRDCVITADEAENFGLVTKKYLPAQWIGIIPAVLFYTFIGVLGVITTGYSDPAKVLVEMNRGGSAFTSIILLVFIIVATWCTNDTANLFPPAYTLAGTFPKYINFAKGVIIAGIIGLVIRPWRATSIINVMVFIANLLAPVAGVLTVDYFFLRKRKIDLDDLYNIEGQYKYWNNINPAAFISVIVGSFITYNTGDISFFAGLVASGVLYYLLMKFWILKVYPQSDIIIK